MKVFFKVLFCFQFVFLYFLQKEIVEKAASKMLVKLRSTPKANLNLKVLNNFFQAEYFLVKYFIYWESTINDVMRWRWAFRIFNKSKKASREWEFLWMNTAYRWSQSKKSYLVNGHITGQFHTVCSNLEIDTETKNTWLKTTEIFFWKKTFTSLFVRITNNKKRELGKT